MSINTTGSTDQVDVRGPRFTASMTTVALVAAFLKPGFGSCLGCQLCPLVARLRRAPTPASI
jgi:hypothetical protein